MKILPCKQGCKGFPARDHHGDPLTTGQMHSRSLSYKCHRCGFVSTITSPEFSSLQDHQPQPQPKETKS